MTTMTYASLDEAISRGAGPTVVPAASHHALLAVESGRQPLRAVRHPLGFFCLPVVRDGDLGVCVHVWTSRLPPPGTVVTSPVHCHSWELVSYVLYGRVTHTLIDVDDDPDGAQRVYEVLSRDGVDEVRPTPRLVRCRVSRSRPTGPGSSYRLGAGQFHSSVADDGEAATVVLGRTTGNQDLTVGDRDLHGHLLPRERCSSRETAALARIALDGLGVAGVRR
ncbi:hypothetical protein KIH74_14515 [Kineosporia sp. J2-2]|uniref:Uncharacterized protein n=1 Tax=Kineosporia corallincola TaxID=2835133 RepID=A0ABS5TGC8_9ACTN|nr:hypothetical protein [Kineosporia corallincola]MBT0770150.1 hypothetical protein [Kineosporia corallincola]